jgi:hypothetical protein
MVHDGHVNSVFRSGYTPAPRLVHYTGRQGATARPPSVERLTARGRLDEILSTGRLRAFPVFGTDDIPVISMSDTSPADLEAAFRTGLNSRGPLEAWALVLDREIMWESGARPVVYADYQDAERIREALGVNNPRRRALVQRMDLKMYRSDWSHEREWRWIARPDQSDLAVWPYLDAVIVGRAGWQPANLPEHTDVDRVERWLWDGDHLIHDGLIVDTSPSHVTP